MSDTSTQIQMIDMYCTVDLDEMIMFDEDETERGEVKIKRFVRCASMRV